MSDTSVSLLDRLHDRQDADAWRELVDLYTPLILGWLRSQGVHPADGEDLVQEVLAVVVRELPDFQHNRRRGAFRAWLRTIALNRLRESWRARRVRTEADGAEFAAALEELQEPDSPLSRLWEREHDEHVARRLLERAEPEFRPATWHAFRRMVLEGGDADAVAAELGMSVNAVLIAKSRVLRRLRLQVRGILA